MSVPDSASERPARPLIEVEDLVKVYRTGDVELRALDGVSFSVAHGEFVAVMVPLIPGSMMSRIITSARANFSRASSPLAAVSTVKPRWRRNCSVPVRRAGSSSTRRIRDFIALPISVNLGCYPPMF